MWAPVMGTDDDDVRHASDDALSSRFRKTKGFGGRAQGESFGGSSLTFPECARSPVWIV